MKERDRDWKSVGVRSRQIVTSFGEAAIKRRLYCHKRTGEYAFLLDEAIGWGEKRRLSPRMERLAVELGTEMPFRRAAVIMGYLVPGVSAMTIWEMTKKAGQGTVY